MLADLLLDFQGARSGNPGLDQIWRETDAGRELREAFLAAIAADANEPDAVALLAARAADLAGRGEAWHAGGRRRRRLVAELRDARRLRGARR